ncbi:hypothetical protein ACP4J4_02810 [Aureimonas ureilytica]|uniref:hypothetical protein n=1 Tax=Aureimonas ureilytica TaxID=401562 RepID=UPI003CE74DE4
MSRQALIDHWSVFRPNSFADGKRTGIHRADVDVLLRRRNDSHVRDDPALPAEAVLEFEDRRARIQCCLLPQPFVGNLEAPVVICLLNPGFDPGDYSLEAEGSEFRRRKLKTLRQDFDGFDFPFFHLDPLFAGSSAFRWWSGVLGPAIHVVASEARVDYVTASKAVSHIVAAVEIVPYHSRTAKHVSHTMTRDLPSSRLAREFVAEIAGDGRRTIIVSRAAGGWDLRNVVGRSNVLLASESSYRTVSLTPRRPAGRAIVDAATAWLATSDNR